MWPIVAGCRQITGLDPSCRRPILLFVALPFFSFTPHPLHTPLHTPSSSLVFVIDHPPLVHLSFPPLSLSLLLPPTLNTTGCRWQRLKANRIFINTTGLQTHSLSTPEVLIVPTVFNSNPHKGDGMTLLAYRVRARVCVCVCVEGVYRWKATKGIKNLWHSRTRLLPDLCARVNIFFSRDRRNEPGKKGGIKLNSIYTRVCVRADLDYTLLY